MGSWEPLNKTNRPEFREGTEQVQGGQARQGVAGEGDKNLSCFQPCHPSKRPVWPRVAHVGGLKCSFPESCWPQSKPLFTFLGNADGTTSHADSQSVHTCIYEVLGLSSSDYYSEIEGQ